ncbi:MAG TPA: O-methyltransferase [Cyclobacteriaceae bacterium]|jgi:predicted O-methyltransferase YrrM
MEFLDEKLSRYAEMHTFPESGLLARINRETFSEVLMPRMLSGHLQGRILSTFSRMIKPKRILEIGTYTGYSTICLAEGLLQDGKIITIDINQELEVRVRKYFKESGFDDKIDFRIGNALEIIEELDEKFDIVFIDADKENYTNYYHLVFEKVNHEGFIVADNVLWSGKVLDENTADPETAAIIEFNDQILKDKRVHPVLMPVRDGLMVIQKLNK